MCNKTFSLKKRLGIDAGRASAAYHSANFELDGSYFDQGFLLPVKW